MASTGRYESRQYLQVGRSRSKVIKVRQSRLICSETIQQEQKLTLWLGEVAFLNPSAESLVELIVENSRRGS